MDGVLAEAHAALGLSLLLDLKWVESQPELEQAIALNSNSVRRRAEFPLKSGHGEADYLLFIDGAPTGVVEAKKEGDTLTGVELQTSKYSEGVPDSLTTPRRPLPEICLVALKVARISGISTGGLD